MLSMEIQNMLHDGAQILLDGKEVSIGPEQLLKRISLMVYIPKYLRIRHTSL
jgi:hypothetical protein